MRIGMLCSRVRVEEKALRDALVRHGADVELVDDRELTLDISRAQRRGDVIVERARSQTHGLAALRVFVDWGVPTVNAPEVVQLCNDKLATTSALHAAALPTPRTVVAFSPESALRAADDIGYPVVLKPVTGSWGRMVARINDRDAAEAIFEDRATLGSPEHSIFYLQEHIAKPGRDIRAFVVDGETICAIYRASDHWIPTPPSEAATSGPSCSPASQPAPSPANRPTEYQHGTRRAHEQLPGDR